MRKVTNDGFTRWNKSWNDLLKCRFQMSVKSKADRKDTIRRGLRSAGEKNLFTDGDAFAIETTDIKRLSRYHMEDVFVCLMVQI